MADPLSVGASIVGLLAAAGKIIEVLSPVVSSVKNVPRLAASLKSEAERVRLALATLQRLLEQVELMPLARTALIQVDDILTILTDGVQILSELEILVDSLAFDTSRHTQPPLTTRIRWARKEKDASTIL